MNLIYQSSNDFLPVVIIGAPRSGTNILRDTLSSLNNVGTWDCDEIPYIWLYSNKKYSTDMLQPIHATPKVKKYIRKLVNSYSTLTTSNSSLNNTNPSRICFNYFMLACLNCFNNVF